MLSDSLSRKICVGTHFFIILFLYLSYRLVCDWKFSSWLFIGCRMSIYHAVTLNFYLFIECMLVIAQ